MQSSVIMCSFTQIIVENFGTTKMPMLKEYKNPYLFFIRKNIFCNYIPNGIGKCSYRDPPWTIKQIKSKLKNWSKVTKEYYRKGQDPTIFAELSRISRVRTDLIRNAKISYIKKVMFSMTNAQIQKSIELFWINFWITLKLLLYLQFLYMVKKLQIL